MGEMKLYVRYFAKLLPKKMIIRIIEQTFESANPRFRKKRIKTRIVKNIPIVIPIPIKEYEYTEYHFDSTAFQSDDRSFSTTKTIKDYDRAVCAELRKEALKGYNTEPIESTPTTKQ